MGPNFPECDRDQVLSDHMTIARFRQRHEAALAELFGEVLGLCAEAGLVRVAVVAVDGTKVHANASHHATRDYEQIAREILEHAGAVDAEEDERFGGARGDELPEQIATGEGPWRRPRPGRERACGLGHVRSPTRPLRTG